MANTTKTTKTAAVETKAAAKAENTTEKKAATKTATEKKAATKTTESATKKTATTKKAADNKKNEFFIQFSGFEFSHDELLEKVKADYVAKTGKKTVTSTKLYIKPEDMKVYYVVNDKFMSDIYLG